MMKEWFCIYFVCILISPTISNEQEYEGGFVNGQQVGKCVAGFCLPFEYQKLETPFAEAANQISIEADIMDVLMVSTQTIIYFLCHWIVRVNVENCISFLFKFLGQ